MLDSQKKVNAQGVMNNTILGLQGYVQQAVIPQGMAQQTAAKNLQDYYNQGLSIEEANQKLQQTVTNPESDVTEKIKSGERNLKLLWGPNYQNNIKSIFQFLQAQSGGDEGLLRQSLVDMMTNPLSAKILLQSAQQQNQGQGQSQGQQQFMNTFNQVQNAPPANMQTQQQMADPDQQLKQKVARWKQLVSDPKSPIAGYNMYVDAKTKQDAIKEREQLDYELFHIDQQRKMIDPNFNVFNLA